MLPVYIRTVLVRGTWYKLLADLILVESYEENVRKKKKNERLTYATCVKNLGVENYRLSFIEI